MYDGKQVLRFSTKYKIKDLYNIGQEMTIRKGTGNYCKSQYKNVGKVENKNVVFL